MKRSISVIKKICLSGDWVCPRCGTTNYGSSGKCRECGNRRPPRVTID